MTGFNFTSVRALICGVGNFSATGVTQVFRGFPVNQFHQLYIIINSSIADSITHLAADSVVK